MKKLKKISKIEHIFLLQKVQKLTSKNLQSQYLKSLKTSIVKKFLEKLTRKTQRFYDERNNRETLYDELF